eukprot:scaffold11902_cov112-Isochrysis_galbana.AAC.1
MPPAHPEAGATGAYRWIRASVAAAASSEPSGDQQRSLTPPRGSSASEAADAVSGGGGAPRAPNRASAGSSAAPSVVASRTSSPPELRPTASVAPSGEKASARAGAGSGRTASIACDLRLHRRSVPSSAAEAATSRDGWQARPATDPGHPVPAAAGP